MWEAFQMIGHRPEILSQIVGQAAISNEAKSFSDLLKQDAAVWHARIFEDLRSKIGTQIGNYARLFSKS